MKVKTSITLSKEVIDAVDVLAGQSTSRSEFIETALCSYIARIRRDDQNSHDLEIINREHVRLNREAQEVNAFQGEP